MHEALMKLQAEKKILAGGAVIGRKADAFIVEAASNEELNQLLRGLPQFGWWKVEMAPLTSFEEEVTVGRQALDRFKGAVK